MLLRETNFEAPHVQMTLAEFIESMKDPNVIRAILDSCTGAAVCPRLIGCALCSYFISFCSFTGKPCRRGLYRGRQDEGFI
jgi:hypothetical protein